MRRFAVRAMVVACAASLPFLGGAVVAAQDATPTNPVVSDETLFATKLDDLPPAPTPVALARITFDPGAGLSMTANPGPALHFVEEGGFTVLMAGAATLSPPRGDPEAIEPGVEFPIGPGDLLLIPAETPFEVFNTGSEPAVALIVEYFARDAGAEFPPGIALAPLVVGELTTIPTGPVVIELARGTLPPGFAMAAAENPWTALVSVEAGTVGYALGEGGTIARAATPGPGIGPATAATPGAEVLLGAGDAVIDPFGSVSALRNAGDEPAILLALTHEPFAAAGTPTP